MIIHSIQYVQLEKKNKEKKLIIIIVTFKYIYSNNLILKQNETQKNER
jgi:hypothetical protein